MDLSQARWFKATASASSNGGCVEVADLGTATGLRDSRTPEAGAHVVPRSVFASFLDDVRAGRYDR
ncbi:DUF397 domain-containing protein [Actinomadura sp. NAK00032]|jgi:phage-related protein|uniref:DUF397 domain-containing protein n=1 Tax=Actinomadura meyerae TaxID=240840 RepID=A0A239MNI2_9ACTN|nr:MULTISPECIES: DUF397 domain-containing protein [Actinomadura]QKW39712.1 DUF397 domain-containing protein [Actinomadura sp. NAK00032]SNT44225.1 protein of unknown function [Actinomadura meyerae]